MTPVLLVVGLIAAWQLFVYKQSNRREWSPLWMAFSSTVASILFLVAGGFGYNLDRHDRFVARTSWSDGPIAWEVWVGAALAAAAFYFWRIGLRSIRSVQNQESGAA